MTASTPVPPGPAPRTVSSRPLAGIPGWMWTLAIAAAVFLVVSHLMMETFAPGAEVRFRIDLSPLAAAPIFLKAHVAGAVGAFVVGLVLLSARKGFGLHRTLGWTWVALMAVTAGSSFFLTGLMGSSYSPIHLLSAWTLIGLPMGVAAVRRRDIASHRKQMTGMFVGGMAVAGLFTFLPGRMMWSLFFTV